MVASIRKSDTKKAQVALRMGVRLNGALNVRVAQPATWPWPGVTGCVAGGGGGGGGARRRRGTSLLHRPRSRASCSCRLTPGT